jgi:hypothetical protein
MQLQNLWIPGRLLRTVGYVDATCRAPRRRIRRTYLGSLDLHESQTDHKLEDPRGIGYYYRTREVRGDRRDTNTRICVTVSTVPYAYEPVLIARLLGVALEAAHAYGVRLLRIYRIVCHSDLSIATRQPPGPRIWGPPHSRGRGRGLRGDERVTI